jgi:hypothetical protein
MSLSSRIQKMAKEMLDAQNEEARLMAAYPGPEYSLPAPNRYLETFTGPIAPIPVKTFPGQHQDDQTGLMVSD